MALVKICGVESARDVDLLRDCGVDLVGVWCGVAGGPRDLPVGRAAALVARAAAAPGCRPVLVTTLADERRLRDVVARTGARWVQLHGWQPPALVRRLKAEPGLTVVKVLHVREGSCPEQRLVPAYERAGTDLFLLDALAPDGRVGSTGSPVGVAAALAVADRCTRPFLLAGGISAANRAAHDAVVAHPLYRGVDVDGAARDDRGRLDARRVGELLRAWRPGPARPAAAPAR
ncbi:phosphoribosylanthranilate isomerase [Micromonospora okii]|uniref:N-(5'-phosphoribosyl)anthranilate isomerase n=1 Tax=Micromonospora okii TaxID=1182970 RepID=A0A023GUP2_9ACTN|nr:hypothetical protein [Micromonospora okii]AFJ52666.1 phosphoribosylanthranilate isomerase [Micromonospora okii]